MSKLEKEEEAKIKKWCDDHNVLFIKFTPFGEKGWPDRIAIFPGGHTLWVELKRKGKEPTALQGYRLNQLANLGSYTNWFDNAYECIEFFKGVLNEPAVDST